MTKTEISYHDGDLIIVTHDLDKFLTRIREIMYGDVDFTDVPDDDSVYLHMDLNGRSKNYYKRWFGCVADMCELLGLGFGYFHDAEDDDTFSLDLVREDNTVMACLTSTLEPLGPRKLIWATLADIDAKEDAAVNQLATDMSALAKAFFGGGTVDEIMDAAARVEGK